MGAKLEKLPVGIPGFDEISYGGLPKGRNTLISGTSGSGKTIFCAQFLYRGIVDFGENGVFVTFEEDPQDIMRNMGCFGWDLEKLVKEGKLAFVDISPGEGFYTVGTYDLGSLIARIEYAIRKVNAQRVAIDSVSALFIHYHEAGMISRELFRMLSKLKSLGVTTVITTERPTEEGPLSRFGIEEFVSDNVVLLHNRLNERGERERTIEILKLRGSNHETREVPIVLTDDGIKIYPRPKPVLAGQGFSEKISVGIKGVDDLLMGGVYKNSITLLTGPSGIGKTVSALQFIIEGVKKGEKCFFIEFEESAEQLYRNAESFGWELRKYVEKGDLHLLCHFPEDLKPEQYLKLIQNIVIQNKVERLALDSLSALQRIYNEEKFREFVIGLNGFLKMQNVTALLTNTTSQLLGLMEITESHLSTASDNILVLKYVELEGKMRRVLIVLKQRGAPHKKELVEFDITSHGIEILGPFVGVENLLGGSGRIT